MRQIGLLAVSMVFVAACARAPESEPAQVLTYSCGKLGPSGTVAFSDGDPGTATLTLAGVTYAMTQVEAASGARYQSAETGHEIWNSGGELMLVLPTGQSYTCGLSA
ncbi:MAG: MliC family protein [Pseudomonadota bacterium]